ncbi:MAG TPA: glutathione S-transferase N-terminal domain-containing protein [Solirubrobacteraceae bacterium]|nr:glutathione S-transferase N-terminal domain-containing protein [Solirubrobacteraceae bacterium]
MARPRVYAIPASPPCLCVEAALRLKGVDHDVTVLPPVFHVVHQRLRFGTLTVPVLTLPGGDVVRGSRAICARIEAEWPAAPSLYPASNADAVREAERWGDEDLQPYGRRMLWWALRRRPAAAFSYVEEAKLAVPLPGPVAKRLGPVLTPVGQWRNKGTDDAVRQDFATLPSALAQVEAFMDAGTIGGEQPNAADLQILAVLRALMTIEDVARVIEARPRVAELARRVYPSWPGAVPAGVAPGDWLPA